MADHSLPPEALRRFLAGTAGPGERKEIARHLLQGCTVCRSFFRQLTGPPSHSLPSIGPSYDNAFEKAQQVIAQGLEALEEPRRLLLELTSHPFARQEMLVRYHRRYRTLAFSRLLARESHRVRFTNLGEMQRLAHLAVLAAAGLDKTAGEHEEVASCRARTWMALGNALRIVGDLNGADRAFLNVQRQLGLANERMILQADLLSHLSSLRHDQHRYEDALIVAQQGIAIRRDLYSPEDVARSLTSYAISVSEGGQPSKAVEVLKEAETILKGSECHQLTLIIRHNSVRMHLYEGKPELASQVFSEIEPLYRDVKQPLIQARGLWMKALILSSLGQWTDALDLFEITQQHFLDQGDSMGAAFVGLDSILVLTKLKKKKEVRRLAANAMREFRAYGRQRDYLAALILLRQAS